MGHFYGLAGWNMLSVLNKPGYKRFAFVIEVADIFRIELGIPREFGYWELVERVERVGICYLFTIK